MLCGCLAFLLVAAGLSTGVAAQAPSGVEIQRMVESTGATSRPWLVCFVFDKSGSMLRPCAEDPTGANRKNWDVVVEDARSKLQQLRVNLQNFDLRMYAFGTAAAEFAKPLSGRTFSIASDADAADLGREVQSIAVPRTGEQTNLWNSLRSIFAGLESTRASSTYGGVVVVVFSDGDDSINASSTPDMRKKGMLDALASARRSTEIRLSVLPIGEWKRDPEGLKKLGALGDIAELGAAIKVPTVTRLQAVPAVARLPQMPESGSTADLSVALRGFDAQQARGLVVALKDAPDGLLVDTPSFNAGGATMRFRAARGLEQGGTATVEVRSAGDDGAGTSFRVVVPGFRKVAPVEQWGLPEPCGTLGGRRVIAIRRGEPIELAIVAPEDARIAWSIDGRPAGATPVLTAQDLSPGLHTLKVEVSTPDASRSAEVTAIVLDTSLSIEAPSSARAGDTVRFTARPTALPDEIAARLGPSVWTVRGTEYTGTDSIDERFDRRGSERVAVSRTLELCGRSFDFSASAVVEIRPGPALRLVGGEVVRGRETRLEALLSGSDEIAKVLFVVDGRTVEASIDPPSGDRPAVAWIKQVFRDGSSVSVRAVPVLKDDSGRDRAPDDPECIARAQSRSFAIVDPDVAVVVEAPVAGASLPFGLPVDVRIVPSGRDADSVSRIEVSIAPASGQPVALELRKASNWTASVTPRSEMGAAVEVSAQAFDELGPLGEPVRFRAALSAARPALRLLGPASSGTLSWSGRNENPPLVSALVVTEGTENPYASAEIRDIAWSTGSEALALESKAEATPQANFAARGSGTHAVRARVKTADGRSYDLSAEIAIRPEPVVPAPAAIDREITGTAEVKLDHSATKGAWTDVILRGQRSDGEWRPLVNGGFENAPSSEESAKVEAWYRPWGAPASVTPWDGRSGWIRSEPLEITLFPPHSPLLVTLAIGLGLAIAALGWKLCIGHVYWGATAWWTDMVSDEPPQELPPQVIGVRERTYSMLFKRVTLPIDAPNARPDEPGPYHWVAWLRMKAETSRYLPSVRFKGGPSELEYRNTKGQSISKAELRFDHPRLLVVVDPPDEYEPPSTYNPAQKPVYLVLDIGDSCKWWCGIALPYFIFPSLIIALSVAIAALWHARVI